MKEKVKQVATANLADDTGGVWELGYYVKEFNSHNGDVVYGIKIERYTDGKREETMGITSKYAEAEQWAITMANGMVTPFGLHDLIDELVG